MRIRRFLWSVHPVRALVEAWLIGLLLMFLLSRQVGYVSSFVMSNSLFFLCGVCGMWTVLRTRMPQGRWLRQGVWELVVGFVLSLVMVIGIQTPARWLRWEDVWLQSSLDGMPLVTLLFLATGPGYVVARGGVRIWLQWDRLRRRRMLWALTHAHLTVVVLIVVAGVLIPLLLAPYFSEPDLRASDTGLILVVIERLLQTVFPAVSMMVVILSILLLVLIPPSALFSYLVARRTTRRLEILVGAAQSLRKGKYDTRVTVVGEDEVAQLQADFNAMAGELERAVHDLEFERDRVAALLQTQRELVASVSHELRTPVATVRGYLESSQGRWAEQLPEPVCRDLEVIKGEIVRLQGLIDDLLTLSRADAGGLELDLRLTDVGAVVRRRVEAIAPLAWQASRVEVTADVPPDLPPVMADEGRLEQVLTNLLRNGVQHTLPGGIVALMAAQEVGAVRIEARDTGEGIAPEDLPHIWERFYRGKSTGSAESGGAGLGLSVVKDLTGAMGGTVAVESTVGQGSCFTVRLPTA